jgi:hypothetical protein
MVSVDVFYLLMPEAEEKLLEEHSAILCSFLLKSLDSTLKRINPLFTVAWDYIYLFGISYGGWMAVSLWRRMEMSSEKPAGFLIRRVLLRCALLGLYRRLEGPYMGFPISKERATADSNAILQHRQQMAFLIPRTGTFPAEAMYPCNALSVAGLWNALRGGITMFDRLQESELSPDLRTSFLLLHGTFDEHVPYQSSLDLQRLFEEKKGWPNVEVRLQEGKSHAWDYAEPLTPLIKDFLDD